jgi:hypothetical protein
MNVSLQSVAMDVGASGCYKLALVTGAEPEHHPLSGLPPARLAWRRGSS